MKLILSYLLILFSCCQMAIGQDYLIQTMDANVAAFAPEEQKDFTHFQNLEYFSEHHLLSDFSLAEAIQNNQLRLQIPGINCGPLSFEAVDIAYQSEVDYKLYATITANTHCTEFDGEMMLMATENGKIGYVRVDSLVYEINQLGEAKLLLSKVDERHFENSHCGQSHSTEETPAVIELDKTKSQERTPPFGYGNCKVRCLILYTKAAADREGSNLMRKIDKAKNQTEQALRNSRVSKNQLSVEWLGPDSVAFVESDDPSDDIDVIALDSQIRDLRVQQLADVVIVLTNGSYGNLSGKVRQIGPDSARAFALTNVDNMTSGRYTFAHEFAHLFGARHENDPAPGIPHGHSWRRYKWFGKKSRSIMHTAGKKPKRVLHYSNPSVSAFGDRTGKTGRRDNAEVLRQGACVVANFLPEPEFSPFSSYIVGKSRECLCQTATFSIRTYGGDPGAVSTKWFTSSNGLDYVLAGDGELYYYELPCPFPSNQLPAGEPDQLFIKAVSTSPDGQEFTDFHRLDFIAMDEDECSFHRINENKSNGFSIQAYPNPIHQQALSIQLDTSLACGPLQVKVLNTAGELMIDEGQSLLVDTQVLHLNVETLEKGIYFVYLQCADGTYSKGQTFVKL